jgi:HK97 family phage prohead protease
VSVDLERRAFAIRPELRAAEDGRPPRVTGYAAVYNQPTEPWPGYFETVAPGAFSKTLREGKPKLLLWDHQAGESIASTKGRPPLRLWEDDRGLAFEAELPREIDAARELEARLRRAWSAG